MVVLIIFPVVLQTVINVIMLSIGGQGIAFLHTCQQDSVPAHSTCQMVEFFLSQDAWFHAPCCLVLIRWTFFISEPDKVHHVCTHGTLWCQRYNHVQRRIFNQPPYFVEIFWIGSSSATPGKNFMQIEYHLSEQWKKERKFLFMKHRVVIVYRLHSEWDLQIFGRVKGKVAKSWSSATNTSYQRIHYIHQPRAIQPHQHRHQYIII